MGLRLCRPSSVRQVREEWLPEVSEVALATGVDRDEDVSAPSACSGHALAMLLPLGRLASGGDLCGVLPPTEVLTRGPYHRRVQEGRGLRSIQPSPFYTRELRPRENK